MSTRSCIFALILFVVLAMADRTFAAGPLAESPEKFTPDSMRRASYKDSERTQRLYDSIQSKSNRRKVPRMLYNILFVNPIRDTTSDGRVLDESKLLKPYAGKTIGEISIERQQVFAPNGNWLERVGNKTHILTRDRVIRRDLLFRPGDKLDPQLIVRNKQLLRSRDYIAEADVLVTQDSLDSTRVNLLIRTRDSWTITIDGALRSESRMMVGLYDANVLGTGNKLKIKTHFSHDDFTYGGNMVAYEIPNVLGTFFTAGISGGRDFYNTDLSFELRKEFLRPTDYEVGLTYSDIKSKHYFLNDQSEQLVKVRSINAWAGRSLYLKGIESSLFLTGRYSYSRFSIRPQVGADLHPALHNHDQALVGAGLYREKFYTANMIYGFGTKEYLATGYKAELVSGYSWGEFNDKMYLGLIYKTGGFRSIGYIMGGMTLGSYIDLKTGTWRQSAVDIDLQWFSNLFAYRRSRMRQFLGLNYTQGWNRSTGADECIQFDDKNKLQALKEHTAGTTRATLNTETVVFTPYQPLGFRIAVFGFADFGVIGYSANMFKNDFFCSFGAGIRLKNERLIFSTIQLRVGVALGKHGLVGSDYFRISNSSRIELNRYRPTRPEIIGYQ